MMFRPIISLGLGASLLAACGSDAPPAETEAEQDRAAKGEVVGGIVVMRPGANALDVIHNVFFLEFLF